MKIVIRTCVIIRPNYRRLIKVFIYSRQLKFVLNKCIVNFIRIKTPQSTHQTNKNKNKNFYSNVWLKSKLQIPTKSNISSI